MPTLIMPKLLMHTGILILLIILVLGKLQHELL